MNTYVLIALFFSCLLFIYFLFNKTLDYISNYLYVVKSKSYIETLEYFCSKAYDLIYKKQIASFTTSGYSVNDDALESIERSYVKITLDIMGNRTKNNLIDFFGGHQYLVDNIIFYIKSRVDNDEILELMKGMEDLNKTKEKDSKK